MKTQPKFKISLSAIAHPLFTTSIQTIAIEMSTNRTKEKSSLGLPEHVEHRKGSN